MSLAFCHHENCRAYTFLALLTFSFELGQLLAILPFYSLCKMVENGHVPQFGNFVQQMHIHKCQNFVPVSISTCRIEHKTTWTALIWVLLHERTPNCQISTALCHTCTYHMEEIAKTLWHIYRIWELLQRDLKRWKGSVTNGVGADLSLPRCLKKDI